METFNGLTKNQALNLGSNEKRRFIREQLTEDAIRAVNPKGYAYLKVDESDYLIDLLYSPDTTNKAPEPSREQEPKPRAVNNQNTSQAEQISKLLLEMTQNQGAQIDIEQVREMVAVEVERQNKGIKHVKVDFVHRKVDTDSVKSTRANFDYMLADLVVGNNVLLSGPTGSGKTVLAKELASAVGCKNDNIYMVSCEPFTFGGDFWGAYKSATEYVEGAFEKAAKDVAKGLQASVVLDEITKLDAELAGTLNAPLSHTKDRKKFFTSGKGVVYDITDVYIIATSNTWGNGFDSAYVGNMQQDASLMNRFSSSKYYVDYDRELEKSLVDSKVFAKLDAIRTKMLEHQIQRSITLRDMINTDLAMQVGKPLQASIECITADWSRDEVAKVGL